MDEVKKTKVEPGDQARNTFWDHMEAVVQAVGGERHEELKSFVFTTEFQEACQQVRNMARSHGYAISQQNDYVALSEDEAAAWFTDISETFVNECFEQGLGENETADAGLVFVVAVVFHIEALRTRVTWGDLPDHVRRPLLAAYEVIIVTTVGVAHPMAAGGIAKLASPSLTDLIPLQQRSLAVLYQHHMETPAWANALLGKSD